MINDKVFSVGNKNESKSNKRKLSNKNKAGKAKKTKEKKKNNINLKDLKENIKKCRTQWIKTTKLNIDCKFCYKNTVYRMFVHSEDSDYVCSKCYRDGEYKIICLRCKTDNFIPTI